MLYWLLPGDTPGKVAAVRLERFCLNLPGREI